MCGKYVKLQEATCKIRYAFGSIYKTDVFLILSNSTAKSFYVSHKYAKFISSWQRSVTGR